MISMSYYVWLYGGAWATPLPPDIYIQSPHKLPKFSTCAYIKTRNFLINSMGPYAKIYKNTPSSTWKKST